MRKRFKAGLCALGLASAMTGVALLPGTAGAYEAPDWAPTLSVTKKVVTPQYAYDVSGVYSVQVTCTGGKGGQYNATLTFKANGAVDTTTDEDHWTGTGDTWTMGDTWKLVHAQCTITEQAGGAATFLAPGSPTYNCTFTSTQFVDEEASAQGPSESDEMGGCGVPPAAQSSAAPATVQFNPWDGSCIEDEPLDEIKAEGWRCVCEQAASVVITNTIAVDPVKVLAAQASQAPAAQPIATPPPFAG